VLLSTPSLELEDIVGVKFNCPHVPVDGNLCIQIRSKMLQFSSTASPTPSPYQQLNEGAAPKLWNQPSLNLAFYICHATLPVIIDGCQKGHGARGKGVGW